MYLFARKTDKWRESPHLLVTPQTPATADTELCFSAGARNSIQLSLLSVRNPVLEPVLLLLRVCTDGKLELSRSRVSNSGTPMCDTGILTGVLLLGQTPTIVNLFDV